MLSIRGRARAACLGCALVTGSIASASSGAAQQRQPPRSPPTFRAGINVVQVDVSAPARDVAPTGGTDSARQQLRMTVAALDPHARVVASRAHTVQLTLDPRAESQQRSYELFSRLELAPGRYEIRAGVDNASGERGSVFTFVDVPDFAGKPLTLSGVSIAASPGIPGAPVDLFADVMPAAPTARRVFNRTDRVTAFVRVGQNPGVPPAHVTSVAPAKLSICSYPYPPSGR